MSRVIRAKLIPAAQNSTRRMVSIRWRVHAGSNQPFDLSHLPPMMLNLPLELARQLHAALGYVIDKADREAADEAKAEAIEAVDSPIGDLPFMAARRDEEPCATSA